LFLIFFGTGFEVLKVVRIHNVIWVRTLLSGYECFVSIFTGSQKMEAVCHDKNIGTHQSDYPVP